MLFNVIIALQITAMLYPVTDNLLITSEEEWNGPEKASDGRVFLLYLLHSWYCY